ncbi:type VI secretion protein IcmF/TssM N-terminal domain-containing protein [Escherichia coli]
MAAFCPGYKGKAHFPPDPAGWYLQPFLHDLLTQFIFREAHLVEPNLQWAWRYRLLRTGGHLLVLALAFWLWQGMQGSRSRGTAVI